MENFRKTFFSKKYKLSKAKEFLGLGFSRETAETLGNLGLKPKNTFQQTTFNAGIYGNFITRLEYKRFVVFKGSKKAVAKFAKELEEMGEEAAVKYLDDLIGKSLDDYINAQDFKFLKLGYRFTHSLSIKNGVKDITHYLLDQSGTKLWQGISTIEKGVLENVFEVSVKGEEVSVAMYKLLDKIGFKKIIGSYYGGGKLDTNYKVFIEVYERTGDKILSAKSTPACRALIKAIDKNIESTNIVIDKINKR